MHSEYALPMPGETRAALFAEGRIGKGEFHGVWGGLTAVDQLATLNAIM